MAKTLIIKNANFAENKLATVTFNADPVPCEGIAFDTSTYTITDYDTVAVNYNVSPVDTTDPITWMSSNTSVATVANGVITPVGLGTTTITATCGNFSASATVTVAFAYDANYQFYQTVNASGKAYLSASYVRSRLSAFGTGEQAGDYNIPDSTSGGSAILYPIKIPQNATRIRVTLTVGTNFYNAADSAIHWLSNEPCGDSSLPNAALYVESTLFNPRSGTPLTVDIPSGADSFVVYFKLSSKQANDVVADDFANASGITIEFLTE